MTTTAVNAAITPLAVALPDPPSDTYFTPEQWTTLLALMDTVVPSLKCEMAAPLHRSLDDSLLPDVKYNSITNTLKKTLLTSPTDVQLDEFLSEKASASPDFQELLKRSLIQYSREDARKGLAFLMSALKYILPFP